MIVPITKSDPNSVGRMQSMAQSKGYLSVSTPGAYDHGSESEVDETSGRALNL
jgi:hypothetical protein